MLTIIYGDDINTLAYEKHKIVSCYPNITVQHLEFDNNHDEIIDQIFQFDLFKNEKLIIINNAEFVFGITKKDNELIKQISTCDHDVYMIMKSKKNNFNDLTSGWRVKKLLKFNESSKSKLITELLITHKVKFASSAIQRDFENLLASDPFLVENEILKLVLSTKNNVISKDAVDNVINDSMDVNVFKLISYLLNRDKKKLVYLYEKLIESKFQPMEILQIISSQLFSLKMQKLAITKGYTPYDIETKIKISKFAQYANKLLLQKSSLEKLDDILNDLLLLDYNLKNGLINQYQGLKATLLKQ